MGRNGTNQSSTTGRGPITLPMLPAALSRRARPTLAALAAGAVALSATVTGVRGAWGASSSAPGADPHVQRAALMVKIAELTDRMDATEAGVVDAQLRQSAAAGSLSQARQRLRDRAVGAYMRGRMVPAAAMDGPSVYLEVAAHKQEDVVRKFRTAREAAGADQQRAEVAAGELRKLDSQLQQARASLDAAVAAD